MARSNASTPGSSLKARALQWLSQREHSRQELRAKLLRLAGDDQVDLEALLDQLVAQGHLSDARFVESRVYARHARFGNRRIELELRQHGLTPDPGLRQQLRATEMARALEVWRKKFGHRAADAAGRAQQTRFMTARGFSAEVVHKIVSSDHDDEST